MKFVPMTDTANLTSRMKYSANTESLTVDVIPEDIRKVDSGPVQAISLNIYPRTEVEREAWCKYTAWLSYRGTIDEFLEKLEAACTDCGPEPAAHLRIMDVADTIARESYRVPQVKYRAAS